MGKASVSLQEKRKGQNNTIEVLDGVRAIACIYVLSYHLHNILVLSYNLPALTGQVVFVLLLSGWSGVTLFFVLSGFLLFMPYARSLLFAEKWPETCTFYLRRAARILPGYYVSLGLLLLFAHPEYLHADHLADLALFLTFLMDAPRTFQKINGPFWTLAIEGQYYVLLPWLAYGIRWIVRHSVTPQRRLRIIIVCLCAMLLWGIGTRYMGLYYNAHPRETFIVPRPILDKILLVIYGSSGKYFEDFAIGMLVSTLFIFTRNATHGSNLDSYLRRASSWLWGAGILLLFFMPTWVVFGSGLSFLEPLIGSHNWLTELGYAFGFGLCIIALLFGSPGLKLFFSWSSLRWIGKISYGLYIWHLPIFFFVGDMVIKKLTHRFSLVYLGYWACAVCITIPFAYVFYRVIEQPWMQLARRSKQGGEETPRQRREIHL